MLQATMSIRMDSSLKSQFASLCEELGLTTSSAITMFMKAMIRAQGLPFTPTLNPNAAETMRAIDEAVQGKDLVGPFHSVKDVMSSLNA